MSYTIAPAAKSALTQATLLAPDRDRSYDGLVGDDAHRQRRSFHNPSLGDGIWNDVGVVCAFDLTHDPDHGCDAHQLVRDAVARRDRRIHEAISQGQIWTRRRAVEGWRPYDGENRHDHHAHVSVAWEYRTDTDPWWRSVPVDVEDELTPDQDARLKSIEALLKKFTAERRTDHKDTDPRFTSASDVLNKLDELATKVDALNAKIGA